jgi:hypothetical protein
MTRHGLVFFLSLTLLGASACGDRRLRAEARAFLSVYESLDHRQQPAEREKKLSALRLLVLVEPEVVKARDNCVAGHSALLRSERAHEEAARRLDEALAQSPDGTPLRPEATHEIRTQIDQAESSLSNAKASLRQCESEARGLSLRFGES